MKEEILYYRKPLRKTVLVPMSRIACFVQKETVMSVWYNTVILLLLCRCSCEQNTIL